MRGLSAFAACAFALVLHSTEYYIAADGDDANDGKSRDKAFASPTMINSKSASGNVFHIYPGTYVLTGAVNPAKADMTIIGEGERPEDVVLDANGIGRGINCGQANTTIANLKVINGVTSGLGGGAYITGAGSLVSNCVFEANTCTNGTGSGLSMIGAGLYAKNTDVVDCAFRRNITVKGGGGLGKEGTGLVSGCLFESNDFVEVTGVSLSYQYGGGGLCLRTAGTTVRDCTFVGNNSQYGGAMHGNPGLVFNCVFSNNTAKTGGVVQMNNGNATTFTTQMWGRCEFVGNYATGQGAVFRPRGAGDIMRLDTCLFVSNDCSNGAAIFARDESAGDTKSRVLTVSNCTFRANAAVTEFYRPFWNQTVAPDEIVGCDFLENELAPAKAYLLLLTAGSKVERCSFVGNRIALSQNYGGCLAVRGSNVVVRSCLFVTNEVGQGRGICVDVANEQSSNEDYWATVENCTFAFNVQRSKSFGGVYGGMIYATSNTVIRNSLFYRNNCGLGKHVFQNFGGTATQAKNVFNCWEAPIAAGQLADGVNGTSVDGGTDLRLVDPAGFDFSLRSRSPLRDKGVAAEWMADAFDLAGAPRLGGSAPDIGAYEYMSPRGFSIKIR